MDTFRIDKDPPNALLRLTLIGFWTKETAHAFALAAQCAAAELPCPRGEHVTLADLTDFKIQSQETVAICQALIARGAIRARRLALVAGPGLARMQIKRIMVRDGMRVFGDVAEAEAWLLAADRSRDAA